MIQKQKIQITIIGSLLFIFLLNISLSAQERKFSVVIEYSANLSKVTNSQGRNKDKLSHMGFLKLEYETNKIIKPLIGIGFLNTGEIEEDRPINFDIVYYCGVLNYNYLVIPVGASISVRSFFINPEIGVGYNLSDQVTQRITYVTGEVEVGKREIGGDQRPINKFSVPVFLTIGKDFKIGNKLLSTGLKGYFGLNQIMDDNNRNHHYYGVGISVGLKI